MREKEKEKRDFVWNIGIKFIFFMLYIYGFLDFGLIEIKIFDMFGELVRIIWNWVLFCYSI